MLNFWLNEEILLFLTHLIGGIMSTAPITAAPVATVELAREAEETAKLTAEATTEVVAAPEEAAKEAKVKGLAERVIDFIGSIFSKLMDLFFVVFSKLSFWKKEEAPAKETPDVVVTPPVDATSTAVLAIEDAPAAVTVATIEAPPPPPIVLDPAVVFLANPDDAEVATVQQLFAERLEAEDQNEILSEVGKDKIATYTGMTKAWRKYRAVPLEVGRKEFEASPMVVRDGLAQALRDLAETESESDGEELAVLPEEA
jgi:hypothetical protein